MNIMAMRKSEFRIEEITVENFGKNTILNSV